MTHLIMMASQRPNRQDAVARALVQEKHMELLRLTKADEVLYRLAQDGEDGISAILLDLEYEEEPLTFVRAICTLYPDIPVVAMINFGEETFGAEAILAGAKAFIAMPFHPQHLIQTMDHVLRWQQQFREVWRLHHLLGGKIMLDDLPVRSAGMQGAVYLAKGVTEDKQAVILEGGEGIGKTLFARAIHGSGEHWDAPFLYWDASAHSHLESELRLIGTEREKGLLARVGEGTLLLKGADALPKTFLKILSSQLQGKTTLEYTDGQTFRGRIIFAAESHSRRPYPELEACYSGLGAVPIALPELKEMTEDIPDIAMLFCERFAVMEGKTILSISQEACTLLQELSWPGNVQQLSQAIFQAVMLCDDKILQVEHFHGLFKYQENTVSFLQAYSEKNGGSLPKHAQVQDENIEALSFTDERGNVKRLQDIEMEIIQYALERYNGHMSKVARKLGIGRSTLYRKLSATEGSR